MALFAQEAEDLSRALTGVALVAMLATFLPERRAAESGPAMCRCAKTAHERATILNSTSAKNTIRLQKRRTRDAWKGREQDELESLSPRQRANPRA